jgi:hypothetical protein
MEGMLPVNATPSWSLAPTFDGNGLMFNDKSLNWLVDYPMILGSTLFYLGMNVVLTKYMKERKAFDSLALTWIMRFYNVVQIVVCSYMIWGFSVYMHAEAPALPPMKIVGYSISFPNLFGINTKYNKEIEYFIIVHYLSKFLDFFDTIFIIIRKKSAQHSFLHVWHHATIGGIWGFLLHMGHGNGTIGYGAFINSVIHVIMYTHYLVSSFKIRHPFKAQITQSQILQFFSCELHAFLVGFSGLEHQAPAWLSWIQIIYQVTMITLFSHFYMNSIKKKKSKKTKKID